MIEKHLRGCNQCSQQASLSGFGYGQTDLGFFWVQPDWPRRFQLRRGTDLGDLGDLQSFEWSGMISIWNIRSRWNETPSTFWSLTDLHRDIRRLYLGICRLYLGICGPCLGICRLSKTTAGLACWEHWLQHHQVVMPTPLSWPKAQTCSPICAVPWQNHSCTLCSGRKMKNEEGCIYITILRWLKLWAASTKLFQSGTQKVPWEM